MTDRPKAKPSHEPSQDLTDAQAAMDEAWKVYEEKRHAYRKAIADELRASGISHAKMAALTSYTEETVRHIAREYKVPPKRKPTVRPLKD
ncbi:hypothetical protein HUT18_11770 [Streptomyces sp. NA04227]|uniref:hypothetical protein n=1 Tax=Streptomyces sp. NA04227 TaxID=2742136 RepID=UPI001591EE36|nr:hypothetical protein [Streptomyces sp. NA04227]QKW06976.1 hypothetical protein HUT18_11770 [Streptomyces sp. NA04227]